MRALTATAFVLASLILPGCEGGTIVIRGEGRPVPPRPVVVAPAPPAAVGTLWAREIRAGRVQARVIHAKEVKAGRVEAGQIVFVPEREAKGWGGPEEVRTGTVHADEIYARKIRAGYVEAGILYVHELEEGKDH